VTMKKGQVSNNRNICPRVCQLRVTYPMIEDGRKNLKL
jgi:hypothetical protein